MLLVRRKPNNGQSGDDGKEDTPVPIPNTKVKLLNADSTSLETDWEGRKLLVKGSLAQLVRATGS